jgi:hypothetical protein
MTKIGHIGVTMAGVAAMVGFTATADAKPGQTVLWNGVRVGMKLAEVKTVLPSASLDGETIVGGETHIAGAKFDSFIKTSGGRVVKVMLIGSGNATSDVMTGLNAKYGRPISPYSCPLSIGCTGAWSAPDGVKITLLRLNGSKGSGLFISYEAVDLSNL